MAKQHRGVHSIILNSIRFILILALISSFISDRVLVQFVSIIALFVTFLPWMIQVYFGINIPAKLEIISLMFIYGILFIGEVRGFYAEFWWWDILLNFIASIALGFIGLSIMYVLYNEGKIDTHPFFIMLLTFFFAFSIGSLWEIFEYFLDSTFNTGLQQLGLKDTMQDMIVNAIGAIIVSTIGFIYIKKGKRLFISDFITETIEKNLWIFGHGRKKEKPAKKVGDLINKGESEKIEFKSSFRVNLHTKEFDRRIEHGVLKTIVAFLNTKGGDLLVGVNDGGQILGLEDDGFMNDDKLGLHLTNLIKHHIGNEFLPFIKFEIVKMKDRKILLVSCRESKKRVFLKVGHEEEFYVRNGPASIKLEGSSLVDYIQHKFLGEG